MGIGAAFGAVTSSRRPGGPAASTPQPQRPLPAVLAELGVAVAVRMDLGAPSPAQSSPVPGEHNVGGGRARLVHFDACHEHPQTTPLR